MWSNKSSANAPATGHPPAPDTVAPSRPAGPETHQPGEARPGAASHSAGGIAGRGRARRRGSISAGIRIVGEITGEEDLSIDGEVNGKISLSDCDVHIGRDAVINADIDARVIEIDGTVTGNLTAAWKIAIGSTGVVMGDVLSPQIQIDEGCKFKGSVQMRELDAGQERPAEARPADKPADKDDDALSRAASV